MIVRGCTLCYVTTIAIVSVFFRYHYLFRAYEFFFGKESDGSQRWVRGGGVRSLDFASLHCLALIVVCHDRNKIFGRGRRQSQISFVLIKLYN